MAEDRRFTYRQKAQLIEFATSQARLGKPSSFNGWWYLDTNCFSEIIKQHQAGHKEAVAALVSGKDVLVTTSLIMELRKRADLLAHVADAFSSANLFLVPDIWKFWYADIANYLNADGIQFNALDVFPPVAGLFDELPKRDGFFAACQESEEDLSRGFVSGVAPDLGAKIDERDLCTVIWSRIDRYANEWFRVEIPTAACTPESFPSFYTYFYVYYFRFIKANNVVPELNDAMDLTNSLPVPYCQRYYGERKFINVLRQVQMHSPPSALALAKRLYKKGSISNDTWLRLESQRESLGRRYSLLRGVELFSFADLRDHLRSASP